MKVNKQVIMEFERTIRMAELKALLKHSGVKPLTDSQYKRAMELKGQLFEKVNENV